ncbi:hypothetical protein BGY98DRAFT_938053 [Russula aff. rugulosa BPL654]|nr:hypothetical protein BGY98DRAFT_938053 [Russula aff. rugulosa BPL654]
MSSPAGIMTKQMSQSDQIHLIMDDSSPLSNEVREDEDEVSQTRVAQDLALQQDDLAPTRRAFDVPCREVDSESMQLHTKLQSALRRVMELERRLGAMRDKRFLRRERIQLGLEISMAAGQHGVSASRFPSMMILLALIVLIIPCAYKYYAFST